MQSGMYSHLIAFSYLRLEKWKVWDDEFIILCCVKTFQHWKRKQIEEHKTWSYKRESKLGSKTDERNKHISQVTCATSCWETVSQKCWEKWKQISGSVWAKFSEGSLRKLQKDLCRICEDLLFRYKLINPLFS